MEENKKTEIEVTADGSVTLYRKDIDEHYHSVKGALAESLHVYVHLGWEHRAASDLKRPLRVFEVGFGTGLNASLTGAIAEERGVATEYFAVELYPLDASMIEKLAQKNNEGYSSVFFRRVNEAEWEKPVRICRSFDLCKIEGDMLTIELPQGIDVVYFDAFAPEKQPEMWSEEIFAKLYAAISPGGVLTTYCAKGVVRRMLQKVGFTTERLIGPPGGKREVLRATKPK